MSHIQFEEPPVEAVHGGERQQGGRAADIQAIERNLKQNPGQWALVYGTDVVPTATKEVAKRWDKKPGFETRILRDDESVLDDNGKKRNPSTWKHKIWIRFSGTEEQAAQPSETDDGLVEQQIPPVAPTPSAPAAQPFAPPAPPQVPQGFGEQPLGAVGTRYQGIPEEPNAPTFE